MRPFRLRGQRPQQIRPYRQRKPCSCSVPLCRPRYPVCAPRASFRWTPGPTQRSLLTTVLCSVREPGRLGGRSTLDSIAGAPRVVSREGEAAQPKQEAAQDTGYGDAASPPPHSPRQTTSVYHSLFAWRHSLSPNSSRQYGMNSCSLLLNRGDRGDGPSPNTRVNAVTTSAMALKTMWPVMVAFPTERRALGSATGNPQDQPSTFPGSLSEAPHVWRHTDHLPTRAGSDVLAGRSLFGNPPVRE